MVVHMKKKKVFGSILAVAGILVICIYVVVPMLAQGLIAKEFANNPGTTVGEINVSWGGPQFITNLHVSDAASTADIDVVVKNSLFSLLVGNEPINVVVTGDASIALQQDEEEIEERENETAQTNTLISTPVQQPPLAIPALRVDISLSSLTVHGDEPIELKNVHATANVDPGMHFTSSLVAITETGGTIDLTCNAPDLFTKSGEINLNTSATCAFSIVDAPIPTINGIGGWSVLKLDGELSSQSLLESINIGAEGILAEYDTPRGSIFVKAQVLNADGENTPYSYEYKNIVGTIQIEDVPTSMLSPFLSLTDINILRDLGPTMNLHVQRRVQGPSVEVAFSTDNLTLKSFVDASSGAITDASFDATINSDLLVELTDGEVSGEAQVAVHLDRLLLDTTSAEDKSECSGTIEIKGNLLHAASNTSIQLVKSDFYATIRTRSIGANGSAILNKEDVAFDIALHSLHKNKLNDIGDLWKATAKQLPRGTGKATINNIPASIIESYVDKDTFKTISHFGSPISASANLIPSGFKLEITSESSTAVGNILLDNNEISTVENAKIKINLSTKSASELFGISFKSKSVFNANIESVDLAGNANFDAIFDVGKQHTFVQGKTRRRKNETLELHMACTGIDTQLLDAICKSDGILHDTIGAPLAVEVVVSDILGKPVLQMAGTAPNALFETALVLDNDTISTVKDVPTTIELQLSPTLTQHLLKDLGPVLADIRSVQHPIQMQISNASASLNNDISALNGTINIDIGEVELDSGSLTMKLLPMFNTKHVEHIPASFEPIHIVIKNGIASYKEFRLILANKFSIPYSGTVNLNNRKLNLRSAIPLTGLGYSIKELRGLTEDIDVPIIIKGTIDSPIAKVDPKFDLGKLLQDAALSAFGEAIGGALGERDGEEAPNPLDLLDELFGGK